MRHIVKLLLFPLLWIYNIYAGEILGSGDNSLPPLYLQPDTLMHRTLDYSVPDLKKPLDSSSVLNAGKRVRSPRGFAGHVSDANHLKDYEHYDWAHYHVPESRGSVHESGTSADWTPRRRQDERSSKSADFSAGFPGFSPDNAKMMMMMGAMKKMDNAAQKSDMFTSILDNPTTLVMATFIPLSLILAATLPLLVKVMMNGITIPGLIPTPSTKTRSLENLPSSDVMFSILDGLAELGSKYLENPDCVQRAVCKIAINNVTTRSDQNYIKRAVDSSMLITNDELLDSFGLKQVITAIRDGKCDTIPCFKDDENSKLKLSRLMNTVMFKHSKKTEPNVM